MNLDYELENLYKWIIEQKMDDVDGDDVKEMLEMVDVDELQIDSEEMGWWDEDYRVDRNVEFKATAYLLDFNNLSELLGTTIDIPENLRYCIFKRDGGYGDFDEFVTFESKEEAQKELEVLKNSLVLDIDDEIEGMEKELGLDFEVLAKERYNNGKELTFDVYYHDNLVFEKYNPVTDLSDVLAIPKIFEDGIEGHRLNEISKEDDSYAFQSYYKVKIGCNLSDLELVENEELRETLREYEYEEEIHISGLYQGSSKNVLEIIEKEFDSSDLDEDYKQYKEDMEIVIKKTKSNQMER